MMTTYKSVHIKECWPYEYVAPVRRLHTREAMDRQNAKRREAYMRKKSATVKIPVMGRTAKVVCLPVYEMGDDICEVLNNATK